MEANQFLKSLRPLGSNLTDAQVLELYHSGRRIYILDEQTDEVKTLVNKAVNITARCKSFLTAGKEISCVRTYYDLLFAGEERLDAIARMSDKNTRAQFICEQVGRMTQSGIFFAKTMELANCLNFSRLQRDSVCRYIRSGKKIQKSFDEKIAQSV